jgi:hypothetical protein
VAAEAAQHRAIFRDGIDSIVDGLRELYQSERAAALAEVPSGILDEQGIAGTARLLGGQLEEACQNESLDKDLLADAFGVAWWAIGSEPGEEPHVNQLAHLADPRLQVVVARYTPLYR